MILELIKKTKMNMKREHMKTEKNYCQHTLQASWAMGLI